MVRILKKKFFCSLILLLFLFAPSALAAPVEGIEINLPLPVDPAIPALALEVGQTATVTATVLPFDADDKGFTWEVINPAGTDVATINQHGQITALREGRSVIKATTNQGGYVASFLLSVSEPTIPVRGISLEETEIVLVVGSSPKKLTPKFKPDEPTGKHIIWTSDDDSIANVDVEGNVTALSPGRARITATTVDGGYTAYCDVEVKSPDDTVTGVTLDKAALTLSIGETEGLVATITPKEATGKHVLWSSSDEGVATVDVTGLVTGISQGTATITVTTVDGRFTDHCNVEVRSSDVPVTGVELNKAALTLSVGETEELIAAIKPENATGKHLNWTSSNESVARVDVTGQVTGISPGTAIVTVITTGGGFTDYCNVEVKSPDIPVTGVTLDKTNLTLNVGEMEELNATIRPENATVKNVEWSSSNEAVATVNVAGHVTGKTPGIARITVTTVDGRFTAYCDVEVDEAIISVDGVELDENSITIVAGHRKELGATVSPINATGRAVEWRTSNTSVAKIKVLSTSAKPGETTDSIVEVIGVSPGNATITVKTADGNFTDECAVEVIRDTGGATEGCNAGFAGPGAVWTLLLLSPVLLLLKK